MTTNNIQAGRRHCFVIDRIWISCFILKLMDSYRVMFFYRKLLNCYIDTVTIPKLALTYELTGDTDEVVLIPAPVWSTKNHVFSEKDYCILVYVCPLWETPASQTRYHQHWRRAVSLRFRTISSSIQFHYIHERQRNRFTSWTAVMNSSLICEGADESHTAAQEILTY